MDINNNKFINFNLFPIDILKFIFRFLESKCLVNLTLVDKFFRNFIYQYELLKFKIFIKSFYNTFYNIKDVLNSFYSKSSIQPFYNKQYIKFIFKKSFEVNLSDLTLFITYNSDSFHTINFSNVILSFNYHNFINCIKDLKCIKKLYLPIISSSGKCTNILVKSNDFPKSLTDLVILHSEYVLDCSLFYCNLLKLKCVESNLKSNSLYLQNDCLLKTFIIWSNDSDVLLLFFNKNFLHLNPKIEFFINKYVYELTGKKNKLSTCVLFNLIRSDVMLLQKKSTNLQLENLDLYCEKWKGQLNDIFIKNFYFQDTKTITNLFSKLLDLHIINFQYEESLDKKKYKKVLEKLLTNLTDKSNILWDQIIYELFYLEKIQLLLQFEPDFIYSFLLPLIDVNKLYDGKNSFLHYCCSYFGLINLDFLKYLVFKKNGNLHLFNIFGYNCLYLAHPFYNSNIYIDLLDYLLIEKSVSCFMKNEKDHIIDIFKLNDFMILDINNFYPVFSKLVKFIDLDVLKEKKKFRRNIYNFYCLWSCRIFQVCNYSISRIFRLFFTN